MERKIKFRAWDGKGKYMFDWFYLKTSQTFLNVLENKLDTTIIMQFTGLKDKNGKEIYEGDIISAYYENKKEVGEVYWFQDSAGFDVKGDSWHSMEDLSFAQKYYTIIGNIYENPELIKKMGNEE